MASLNDAASGQAEAGAAAAPSVDAAEIARFAALAATWWDPTGPFRPLHKLGPTRIEYVRDRLCAHFDRKPLEPRPLAGLRILDIGCGGGLICEPLARLGAEIVGIDVTLANIAVARDHAAAMGLTIDYRLASAEAMAAGNERFDAVLALEVIEHVADPPGFLAAAAALLRPGGAMVLATLNRTARAYVMAIVGAEYVLGWLPRGTHDWRRFLRPSEIERMARASGLKLTDLAGMTYNPLSDRWALTRDLGVNYLALAVK